MNAITQPAAVDCADHRALLDAAGRLALAIESRRAAHGLPDRHYSDAVNALCGILASGTPSWLIDTSRKRAAALRTSLAGMLGHAGVDIGMVDAGTVIEAEILAARKAGNAIWLALYSDLEEAAYLDAVATRAANA